MKFILLVYNEPAALDSLPPGDFDNKMRHCLAHADELKHNGRLIESQMLEDASTAKSVRIRNGRQTTLDGPFAETKEVLGGFNLIEAENIEEAVRIAAADRHDRSASGARYRNGASAGVRERSRCHINPPGRSSG